MSVNQDVTRCAAVEAVYGVSTWAFGRRLVGRTLLLLLILSLHDRPLGTGPLVKMMLMLIDGFVMLTSPQRQSA